MSSKDILGLGWTTERKTSIAAADRHKLLSITDDGTKSLPALADVDFAWSCLVFAEHGNGITLDPDGSELVPPLVYGVLLTWFELPAVFVALAALQLWAAWLSARHLHRRL